MSTKYTLLDIAGIFFYAGIDLVISIYILLDFWDFLEKKIKIM